MLTELEELKTRIDSLTTRVEASQLEAEPQIVLDNHLLDECLKNQVLLQLEWEQFMGLAAGLENESEALKDQYHSYAFVQAHSQSKRVLNSTDAKRYADVNNDYVDAVKVYNKIYRLRKEIEAILNAVNTRKFVLNNMTNAAIHGINKSIL